MTSAGTTWKLSTRRGDMSERLSRRVPANEIESYLAGLLVTDGTLVRENGRPMAVNLGQGPRGHAVIEQLADYYGRRIGRRTTVTNFGPKNEKRIQLRCVPLAWKQFVVSPGPDLLRHYIRGMVDGDGCVVADHGSVRVEFYWRPDEEFIGHAFWLLVQHYRPTAPRLIKSGVRMLSVSGRPFARWLYHGASIAMEHKSRVALS